MHDTNTPIGEATAAAEGMAPPGVAPDLAPLGRAPLPRLYLRLAITGHRHAARLNEGAARRGLARAFDACADVLRTEREHAADLNSSDGAELVLLSALAEGADQIAVDVFTARQGADGARPRTEVVIPFDVEGYVSTMDDAAAGARMREMAKAASACMVMADGSPDAGKPDDPHEAHWRDHRYAMVGDILVRQADVLIAVWDGVPSTAMGGAAWVIASALREGVPVLWVDAQDGHVRLLTPHSPHGELLGAVARPGGSLDLDSSEAVAGLRERLAPLLAPAFDSDDVEEHDFDAYARSRRSYRSFFGNGRARKPKLRTWATAYSRLLWFTGSYVEHETTAGEAAHPARTIAHRAWPASKWPGWRIDCAQTPMPARSEYLKDWSSDRLRENIALPWITFDTMATRLGHIYRSSYVITFLFAALAVLVALSGQFAPVEYETYLSLMELGALFVAGSSFLLSRFFRVHDRWVIARDIEGRFRAAWNLAQLGLGGRRALKRASAPWPTWAVQAWAGGVGLPSVETTRERLAGLAAYLRKTAVADQIAYHRSNAGRLHMLHHTLEWAGKIAFFAAFCVCIAAFAHHRYHFGPDLGSKWNLFIGAGMPAVAAALAGLRYQGDFLRFATRSARTAHDLGAVEAELTKFIVRMQDGAAADKEKRDGFAELRDIVLSLEAVLIADLQDWRYVHAARPNPEP